jgi:hypothetical protein
MAINIGFASDLGVNSELIRNFYETNWMRKIALSDKKFYDWQFIETPGSVSRDNCVIAYDDEKVEVLGVMGLNKREFFLNNRAIYGAELTTWAVCEQALGSGLGAKILGFIQKEFEVLIGMGISEMALPIYMRSGFRYLSSIPRFIKVINFENLKLNSTHTNLAVKLIKQWSGRKANSYYAKEVNSKEYEDLFNSFKVEINLFTRNNIHRLWRFEKHPFFKYKQYLIGKTKDDTSAKSFIAFREESNLKNFKILHVVDLFGEKDCIPSAISFVENYARDNEFDVIDFYCTASSIYRFMLGGGWFSINDDKCFQFPHLFHPIEMRNPPTTSLIYWSKNHLNEIADISKLYITKQDADLDRPTIHSIELFAKGLM